MNVPTVRKRLLSGVVVFLILMGLMVAVALAATPPPLNLPAGAVTATYGNYLNESGWPAAFRVTFSGIGTGYSVSDSLDYLGWCLEDNHLINSTTITLYSSYDPNLPANVATYTDSNTPAVVANPSLLGQPIPWDKLNYLLNHKPSGNGLETDRADTQAAIKLLIYGASTDPIPSGPALAAVADAQANGAGFVPAPGQVIAVILHIDGIDSKEGSPPTGNYQEAIIELTVGDYYDRGDLPEPTYPTYITSTGASHLVGPNLYLGQCVDAEADGQPNANALGDDPAGTDAPSYGNCTSPTPYDDEDGVTRVAGNNGTGWSNGAVSAGNGGAVQVIITSTQACVGAFFDFGSGLTLVTLLDENGDTVIQPIDPGTHTFYFDIPAGTFNGTTNREIFARFRASSPGNDGCTGSASFASTGPALSGEVEDYAWTFGPNAVSLSGLQASPAAVLPLAPLGLATLTGLGAAVALWARRRRS